MGDLCDHDGPGNHAPGRLRRLLIDRRAVIAVTGALALPTLVLFAGLAIDASNWQAKRLSMQAAADLAAMGASLAYLKNAHVGLTSVGQGMARINGFAAGGGTTVQVNQPPASGSDLNLPQAIEVIIRQPATISFSGALFRTNPPQISARAVAAPVTTPTCVMALNQSTPDSSHGAIDVTGSGSINVNAACAMIDDSKSLLGLTLSGSAQLNAPNVNLSGSYALSGGAILSSSSLKTNVPVSLDPYANTRSIPSYSLSGCDPTANLSGHITNPTGVHVFCGGNVTVNGSVQLDPGVYIVDGNGGSANFTIQGSGNITGSGVTIIITALSGVASDNGVFTVSGSATITLSAPTSGSTAGIVFWADGRLPAKTDNISGGGLQTITGAIYLPNHTVNYSGSATATPACNQLVAYNISLSGTANFNHSCAGVLDAYSSTAISLVE
jgi:hypothetical protein